MTPLLEMAKNSKAAAHEIATAETTRKDRFLKTLATLIQKHQLQILEANRKDLGLAESRGLEAPLIERLSLEGKLNGIVEELKTLQRLDDPVAQVFEKKTLPNGLVLEKQRSPLGVLGVIYESRPNVTVDVVALAIKSGNCVILRGGTEALQTNRVFVELIQQALKETGLPYHAVQLIVDTDRRLVRELLQLDEFVDLIIPRGNHALQVFCKENSRIPVITGGVGICHLFVDETADFKRSIEVIINAKTDRPSVCNAVDTLLVHERANPEFVPQVIEALSALNVKIKLDPDLKAFLSYPSCSLAQDSDWDQEWLSLVLGIKVVKNLDEALQHISRHGSGHSDGILTENLDNIERFKREVDSAAVYINASTRFTDGGQFGLGGEVAVSTQKLHARGPVGLNELTTYKWVVTGDYHIRRR